MSLLKRKKIETYVQSLCKSMHPFTACSMEWKGSCMIHDSWAQSNGAVGNGVHFFLRSHSYVKLDAEYNGADRFLKTAAQIKCPFWVIMGPKQFSWHFGQAYVHSTCFQLILMFTSIYDRHVLNFNPLLNPGARKMPKSGPLHHYM